MLINRIKGMQNSRVTTQIVRRVASQGSAHRTFGLQIYVNRDVSVVLET